MYMCMDRVSGTPFQQAVLQSFKYIRSKCLEQFLCMCRSCFIRFEVALFFVLQR